jgi:hypothetical protein
MAVEEAGEAVLARGNAGEMDQSETVSGIQVEDGLPVGFRIADGTAADRSVMEDDLCELEVGLEVVARQVQEPLVERDGSTR